MVTAIYASILAVLMCWLAFRVIAARRKQKVRYADGGVLEVQIARAAHSNAVDYIPITLILLFLFEWNGANAWLVHIIGLIFIVGRVIHARGILLENHRGRVLGMQITISTIIGLAILNPLYWLYTEFLLS